MSKCPFPEEQQCSDPEIPAQNCIIPSSHQDNRNDNQEDHLTENPQSAKLEAENAPSVCQRMCHELSFSSNSSLFSLIEADGSIIDIKRTFAPGPAVWIFPIRSIVFFGWSTINMIFSILKIPKRNRWTYMIYATRWCLLLAIVYFFLSAILTILETSRLFHKNNARSSSSGPVVNKKKAYLPSSDPLCKVHPSPEASKQVQIPKTTPSFLVFLTWALYNTVLPLNISIILFFWPFVRQYPQTGPITYHMITEHGLVALLLFIDGTIIGCIPLRWKQIIFPSLLTILYVSWTAIHYYLGIGDGWWPDRENGPDDDFNDDLIYDVFDWAEEPWMALGFAFFVLFLLNPLCFGLSWTLSLWSWDVRHYKCLKFDGSRRRILE